MDSFRRIPIIAIAAAFAIHAIAKPPVCALVTSMQTGSDGANTGAIQQQLDLCGAQTSSQAAVELTASGGFAFTSGPLYLPSNVVLWLDPGVVLNASTNPSAFERTAASRTQPCYGSGSFPVCGTLDVNSNGCEALINACKVTNAGVAGPGVIEGHGWSPLTGGPNSGTDWWTLAGAAKSGGYVKSLNAPKMIDFQQSTNISVSGITIHNAPLVHMLFGRDSGVSVSQVTIVTPTPSHSGASFPYNSDGMDASGSINVQVDRADFADGDDNIAFEGGGGGAVHDVSVTNSVFRAGHGLSIGSPTSSGVTDVSASNIVFLGSDNGVRIKSSASSGGVVDRIRYSNICMKGVKNPIVIDPYYSTAPGTLLPMFRTVEIDNFYADTGNLTLKALSGQAPLALTLNNVRMDKVGSVAVANANIAQISDPKYPFPIAIPTPAGVSVMQSVNAAAQPTDIKAYCQTALAASQNAGLVNVVSAASYEQNAPLAGGEIISIFGEGIEPGAVVMIADANGTSREVEIFAATTNQINAHLPAGMPSGLAVLSIQTSSGASFWSPVTIASSAPALFSANSTGTGAAAAQLITTHADGSQTIQTAFQCASGNCTAVPLDLGAATDTSALVIYATGMGSLAPGDVNVLIGGVGLQPFYVGAAPGFPGLDQVNVILPRSLAGSGVVQIQVMANGATSNTVTASFR